MLWSKYVPGYATNSEPSPRSAAKKTHLELPQPLLALIGFLLAEGKLNELFISFDSRAERDHVLRHVTEVVSGVFIFTRSQTLCYIY